jgi:hypothetical protein
MSHDTPAAMTFLYTSGEAEEIELLDAQNFIAVD